MPGFVLHACRLSDEVSVGAVVVESPDPDIVSVSVGLMLIPKALSSLRNPLVMHRVNS